MTRLYVRTIFVFLSLAVTTASANQPWVPYLVKDINQDKVGDSISHLMMMNGIMYFTASKYDSGIELWRSDGTDAGTLIVKDIMPGRDSSNINELNDNGLVENNGEIFFVANDGVHGFELWKSDGTEGGTVLVKDIYPGAQRTYKPNDLVSMNGVVYFEFATRLWRSDGTEQGTYYLSNDFFAVHNLTNINGTLYFSARSALLPTGHELWKSDGTAAGTELVVDLYPGKCGGDYCGSSPSNIVNFNGLAYFTASDGVHGTSLWRSDGTAAGTYLVKAVNPVALAGDEELIVSGGNLFFQAKNDGSSGGYNLWKSDGTESGTIPIQNFKSYLYELTGISGKLWFVANDQVHGYEPWVSDGTESGTYMVKDIDPYNNPGYFGTGGNYNYYGYGGKVYFIKSINAGDGAGFVDSLWQSDGTQAGTDMISSNVAPKSAGMNGQFVGFNNGLYFYGEDGGVGGELYRYDLNSSAISMVKKIRLGETAGGGIGRIFSLGRTAYFTYSFPSTGGSDHGTGNHSIGLWKTDGSEQGTQFVGIDFYSANGDLLEGEIVGGREFRNKLLLDVTLSNFSPSAPDGSGYYLILTDGTAEGTKITMKVPFEYARNWTVIDDQLYYLGTLREYDSNGVQTLLGKAVYRLDATPEGTVELARYIQWTRDDSGQVTSFPCFYESGDPDFTGLNGSVYFQFCDQEHGHELWQTNGTPEETRLVADIDPTHYTRYSGGQMITLPSSGKPEDMEAINGQLFFSAYTTEVGREPWRSDGTNEGTYLLKDIRPGFDVYSNEPNSSGAQMYTGLGNLALFKADDGSDSSILQELWASDGTPEGTVNIKSPYVPLLDRIDELITANGRVFFTASDIYHDYTGSNCDPDNFHYGLELWSSDGTEAGTSIVKDIMTRANMGDTSINIAIGDSCWGSGVRGITYDYQGPYLNKQILLKTGENVLFAASTPETGGELWKSDGTESGTKMLADINEGYFHSNIAHAEDADGKVFFQANDGMHGAELWAVDTYREIDIDIKPGSSSDCINFNEHGVIPVVIYGSEDVDVRDIKPESLTMQGLSIKMAGKSGKYLMTYEDVNDDGILDISAKFEDSDDYIETGSGVAEIKGYLLDGTSIRGQDQVCLVGS